MHNTARCVQETYLVCTYYFPGTHRVRTGYLQQLDWIMKGFVTLYLRY